MATKIEDRLPNGDVATFYTLEGLSFKSEMVEHLMSAKDLDLQMKWVKETPIRDDDVIICAYPKTGTHWIWEIVNMVLRGTAEYHRNTKEAAMLEFSSPEVTSSMTSPRTLNTHLTHTLLPTGIKEKKSRIIHVIRNPKDVAVSLYFHIKGQKSVGPPPSFEMFTKIFRGVIGQAPYCSYMWYLKHWEQFQADNPDYPLLNVYYEDMKKNPGEEINRIAKFLDKDVDGTTIKEISTKCNFQNMQQAHAQKMDPMDQKIKEGGIGDWKNHLTVAENEEFDKWIETELKDSDIKFQYE